MRASEADWQQVRAIRLRALEADPSAFASSLQSELALGEQQWRERIRGAAWFLAVDGDQPAGMAAVLPTTALRHPSPLDPDGSDTDFQVISMWVAPELRGQRIGEALLQATLAEARAGGAERVRLWVTNGNSGALTLYTRCGFVSTGRTEPLLSDPQLTVAEYVLGLG